MTLEGKSDVTEKKLTLYGVTSATFSSGNKEVATVTKNGTVKAKKLGTAVITAKNKKGKKSSTRHRRFTTLRYSAIRSPENIIHSVLI